MKRFKRYFKKVEKLIMRPEMKVLPGQLAFFLILSIFPVFTLLGYIGSKFSLFSSSFLAVIKEVIPSNFLELILPFVTDSQLTGNTLVIMILGFILASNGTHSLIVTSNELYHLPYADYIKRRIKAFLMTILFLMLFIFIFIVLAYGNVIVSWILDIKTLAAFHDQIYYFFLILKWPVAFFLIFIVLKYIYTVAPDARIPSKFMNTGALFATIGIILITLGYSLYVNYFANYTLFYGSISGIIMLMIWVYLISFVLSLGIAINSTVYANYKEILNKKEKDEDNS